MKFNKTLLAAVAGALLMAAVFAIGMGLGFHRGKSVILAETTGASAALTKQQRAFAKRLMEFHPDLEELELGGGKRAIKQSTFWAWLDESLDSLVEHRAQQQAKLVEVAQATWRIGQEDCALAVSEGLPYSDEVRAQAAGEVLSTWFEDRFKEKPGWPATLLVASAPVEQKRFAKQAAANSTPVAGPGPAAHQSIPDLSAPALPAPPPSTARPTTTGRLDVATGEVAVTQANLKAARDRPSDEPELARLLDLPKNAIRRSSESPQDGAAVRLSPQVRERYRKAFTDSP